VARKEEVEWIIEELRRYLSVDIRREDVRAAWYT
jgi:glycerol-3-phosphate dehydrogenase